MPEHETIGEAMEKRTYGELSPDDSDRAAYPYAVGVGAYGETTYIHFSSKPAANLFAELMDGGPNTITRWVAVDGPEHSLSTPVPGWRQVTFFFTGSVSDGSDTRSRTERGCYCSDLQGVLCGVCR